MKKSSFQNYTAIIVVLISILSCSSPSQNGIISLIPAPVSLEHGRGFFEFDSSIQIVSDLVPERLAPIKNRIEEMMGWSIQVISPDQVKASKESGNIRLIQTDDYRDKEGYRLEISKNEVRISAACKEGHQNALATLNQLLIHSQESKDISVKPYKNISLPVLTIIDSPRFSWRGLMLDCSRTFIPIDELRRYVDRLAFYKLNILHLHLSDDQGWRLEIKKYPELTSICSEFDSKYTNQSGGFYTQEAMRGLIAYASSRNVTIIPEIEMPGHSSEVFAAFPDLSCSGDKSEIYPFFSGPGITADIFCAGKESVFVFLENVLDEVCDLFPSDFIHIGGDEAPKIRWQNCDDCQGRIREEGLKDEHELQSYFIRRIEKMLSERGKTLIGWDEILEGGLADNAAIMSWRGVQGGISAARAGHPVVMSPTSHCYFDYSHNTTPLKQVYDFDPIPDDLNASEAEFILGGQANFWSHIDRSIRSMQRQIFPRIIALSEALWSDSLALDYADFTKRMSAHYSYLDSTDVSYYHPDLIAVSQDSTDIISRLRLEGYYFDFHGYQGIDFNYRGMVCKIVQPKASADGNPWIWRARFWGHEPQLDVALLEQGYHVVYCDIGNLFGNKEAVRRWDQFYNLMQKGELADKGVLEGMSRGGLIIYNWAAENPDKVVCIYADAPVLDGGSWPGGLGEGKGSNVDWARFQRAYEISTESDWINFNGNPIDKADIIARTGIPLLHICGEADEVVPIAENTNVFEQKILAHGGNIKVIRKPGVGHHPHSLKDPAQILEFINSAMKLKD